NLEIGPLIDTPLTLFVGENLLAPYLSETHASRQHDSGSSVLGAPTVPEFIDRCVWPIATARSRIGIGRRLLSLYTTMWGSERFHSRGYTTSTHGRIFEDITTAV